MAAAIDPVSAIAGAIGDTAQSLGTVATAVGSIFSSRNERRAVEATASSNQEIARIGYLNTGLTGLVDIRKAELEIQRQQTQNQGGLTPITALVLFGGLTFFALVVYLILMEVQK